MTFNSDNYKNESDVEQKLIYILLNNKTYLGFNEEEIYTKKYLIPRDIDKGAGKKTGYYPDYAIILGGIFSMVVEAKSPNESVDEGFREAQLYAHEINKRFPEGVNPAKYVISCNGIEILYGSWDNDRPNRIPVNEMTIGKYEFESFLSLYKRDTVLPGINKIRAGMFPNKRFKPLIFTGGPARQNQEISPNRFSEDLIPILRKYFDSDAVRATKEIIEKAYVNTEDVTRYDKVLETLLKDNISRIKYPNHKEVNVYRKDAPDICKTIKDYVEDKDKATCLLLIGGVGSGKSSFIDRFYYFLLDEEIKRNTLWIFLDFNNAPNDIKAIEKWVVPEALRELIDRNNLSDFYNYKNLTRYFAPDIDNRNKGAYHKLRELDPVEYERRLSSDITSWTDDTEKLFVSAMRYFAGDKRLKVITVFDNVDRRDSEQQLGIFQLVHHYRNKYKSFSILSMRDETYDRYKSEPPLDAFYKPFAFRIRPPRFIDVVKRRLSLIIDELTANAPEKLSYTLENGIVVEYPATDLGRYLMGVYKALFNTRKRVRLILEALADRDVRYALQMFSDLLISGHMKDGYIFQTRYKSDSEEVFMPEWLVVRILMRTKHLFYSSDRSYIFNILGVSEKSDTATNFMNADILCLLSSRRKTRGELGIEGYVLIKELIEEIKIHGYIAEDVLSAIKHLVKKGLLISETLNDKIDKDNYVKISASGHYHINVLLQREEYLANIAIDTFIRNDNIAKEIASTINDDQEHRINRIRLLNQALKEEKDIHDKQSFAENVQKHGAIKVLSSIEEVLLYRNQ
ncbi:MAG: type I restriction endonuclease [Anaerohalosphaeraceae bacterium]